VKITPTAWLRTATASFSLGLQEKGVASAITMAMIDCWPDVTTIRLDEDQIMLQLGRCVTKRTLHRHLDALIKAGWLRIDPMPSVTPRIALALPATVRPR
jgi:hypothetical protein